MMSVLFIFFDFSGQKAKKVTRKNYQTKTRIEKDRKQVLFFPDWGLAYVFPNNSGNLLCKV